MKKEIHPESTTTEVKCSTCEHVHTLTSTESKISIDVCSNCHSFYTGDSSAVKATGRVERFNRMFGDNKPAKKETPKAAKPKEVKVEEPKVEAPKVEESESKEEE